MNVREVRQPHTRWEEQEGERSYLQAQAGSRGKEMEMK